jgi:hypothetical protein
VGRNEHPGKFKIGSAVLAPTTLALLKINFPEGPERMRAIFFYAAIAEISAGIRLELGGILADRRS